MNFVALLYSFDVFCIKVYGKWFQYYTTFPTAQSDNFYACYTYNDCRTAPRSDALIALMMTYTTHEMCTIWITRSVWKWRTRLVASHCHAQGFSSVPSCHSIRNLNLLFSTVIFLAHIGNLHRIALWIIQYLLHIQYGYVIRNFVALYWLSSLPPMPVSALSLLTLFLWGKWLHLLLSYFKADHMQTPDDGYIRRMSRVYTYISPNFHASVNGSWQQAFRPLNYYFIRKMLFWFCIACFARNYESFFWLKLKLLNMKMPKYCIY